VETLTTNVALNGLAPFVFIHPVKLFVLCRGSGKGNLELLFSDPKTAARELGNTDEELIMTHTNTPFSPISPELL